MNLASAFLAHHRLGREVKALLATAIAMLVLGSLPVSGTPVPAPTTAGSGAVIEVVSYNSTVGPGAPWRVDWRIQSGETGRADHANVHWGDSPGVIADDYPNSGDPSEGPVPGEYSDPTLVAPLVPGRLYVRVHARIEITNLTSDIVSDEFVVLVEHPVKSSPPGVHLVDSPKAPVDPGDNVTITWQAIGGKPGNVSHTNVHWGTKPGDHSTETPAQSGLTPQTFTAKFAAPAKNTEVFFILHAIVDTGHVQSAEFSFRVGVNPTAQIVWADHFPKSVPAGTKLTVRWRVEGGIPGIIQYTHLAWGLGPPPLTKSTPDQAGNTQGGTLAVEFTDTNITVPGDATDIYYEAVAVVDGVTVRYQVKNVSVIGGSNVIAIVVDEPPPRVEAGSEFPVSWKIRGGVNVDLTRFEYGFEPGIPKFKGNEIIGKPGELFLDIIKAPDTQGRVYYQIFFRVDGSDFSSPEGDFFVFAPGSSANLPVIAAMGGLVLLLVLLVVLLMRQQTTRRDRSPEHVPLDDAREVARRWLGNRYGTEAKSFRFHDAYQLDDGYDVVFESRHGTFKYRVRVDNEKKVRRFSGG